MTKINYTWEDFEKDFSHLKKAIYNYKGIIKDIYAVPRGGLIFGVKLSYLLDAPLLLDEKKISGRTLIVDDIADTGNTLKRLLKNKNYFSVVTLWVGPDPTFKPTMSCRLKTSQEWVIYPWEQKETSKYDRTI